MSLIGEILIENNNRGTRIDQFYFLLNKKIGCEFDY
jgi:hypothetical protein